VQNTGNCSVSSVGSYVLGIMGWGWGNGCCVVCFVLYCVQNTEAAVLVVLCCGLGSGGGMGVVCVLCCVWCAVLCAEH
jgi:hypothetical protein